MVQNPFNFRANSIYRGSGLVGVITVQADCAYAHWKTFCVLCVNTVHPKRGYAHKDFVLAALRKRSLPETQPRAQDCFLMLSVCSA